MPYKFARGSRDYSDFASGRVFYSLPGHPAFPVRLASEIFQRCISQREKIYGDTTPVTLYDPCCGGAYHLSVLAYLHGNQIREVIASDIDDKAVAVARRNLGLLGTVGLERRISEISQMFEQYGKESHKEALASAYFLKDRLSQLARKQPLLSSVFQADATDKKAIIKNIKNNTVDIVFADVPYGQHSRWETNHPVKQPVPLWSMLEALLDILSRSGIVAIVSDKGQKAFHERYRRIEQFQIGKRRAVILMPIEKPGIWQNDQRIP